jgi:hypothetical protein
MLTGIFIFGCVMVLEVILAIGMGHWLAWARERTWPEDER